MLTEASNYDELYRDFRWDIPARFNIATAMPMAADVLR
jgi:acetyl-CoA synthetase